MLQPGSQVGRYEIQRRLGRGGMGAVYVAHDPILGRMVAIKVFAGDLDMPDARERFVREARSAAALTHSNIVTVYDFGELPSEPYIVMEYVQGETLAQVIRRKAPIPLPDKLRWVEELCAGVGYAHQHSVLHRDIKPANLMIDRSGRLRILDFGIARLMGTASTTTAVIGTPGYMAPEQLEGGAVDQRADLFSVGAVTYELLTYTEAFPGDSAPAITHRIMTANPVPIARAAPDVSPEIAAIVEQALSKKPADRPKDAETLRSAIGSCRRQFESGMGTRAWEEPASEAPTLLARRPGDVAKRPATGPAESTAHTPPPDQHQRRTDREALARRRTAQVDAALALAKLRLSQGDLDGAIEACEQALTLDETHQAALELEWELRTAIAARDSAAVPSGPGAGDGGGTIIVPRPPTGPHAGADSPRRDPEDSVGAVPASALPDVPAEPHWDATVVVPPRVTPPPSEPTSAPPVETESETTARIRQKAGDADSLDPADGRWSSLRARVQALPPKTKTVAIWTSVGALGVVAVTAAALAMLGPAATGALVIEAVPWATVTAVESEDGEPQALPAESSTPLLLNVPAGRYQVSVVGPPPTSESRRITVEVQPGVVTAAPAEVFRAITPEEYFGPYLSAASAGTTQ